MVNILYNKKKIMQICLFILDAPKNNMCEFFTPALLQALVLSFVSKSVLPSPLLDTKDKTEDGNLVLPSYLREATEGQDGKTIK